MSSKDNATSTIFSELDKRDVDTATAVSLNVDRLVFASRILQERFKLSATDSLDAAIAAASKTDALKAANIKVLKGTRAVLETLWESGPAKYIFAAADSKAATEFSRLFDRSEYKTPPKHWSGRDKEVPDLFIPYLAALALWEAENAKREAARAEREAAAAEKQTKAEAEKKQAEAERSRQALEVATMAEALFASADPNVLAASDKEREERARAKTASDAAKAKTLKDEETYFGKVLDEKVSALGYKNRDGKWAVSNKDTEILNRWTVAEYASMDPATTEMRSVVPGSTYAGFLGDTHKGANGHSKSDWMAFQAKVAIRTQNGQAVPLAPEDKPYGIFRIHSRQATTFKAVAEKRGLLDPNDTAAFWEAHRLQSLLQKAEWAADSIRRKADKRDNGSSSDDPSPPKVLETLPEGNGEGEGLVPEEPRRERKPRRSPEERNEAEGKGDGTKPQTEPEDTDEDEVDVEEVGDEDILVEAVEAEAEKPELPLDESGSLTQSPFATALAALAAKTAAK